METEKSIGQALLSVVTSSPNKPASSSVQRVLDARMMLSEAIEAATAVISGYPNGGTNAGDSYIGALASTLMGYPRQIALRCADFPRRPGQPLRGISATCRFLPTPADIIAWCEKETAPLRHDRQREINIANQFKARAEFKAPRDHRLSYAELKAKYGAGDGWSFDVDKPRNVGLSIDELIAIVGESEWTKIPNRVAAP